jgi:hypothetical protein
MRSLNKISLYLLVPVWVVLAAVFIAGRKAGRRDDERDGIRQARDLIIGDGGAPIENSAFIVEDNQFTRVGRRGEVQAPAGARRVDLSGKTSCRRCPIFMATSDSRTWPQEPCRKQTFTRENLIAHSRSDSLTSASAQSSASADLVDRAEPNGGRNGIGATFRCGCATRSSRMPRCFVPRVRENGVAGIRARKATLESRRVLSR